MLMLDGVNHPCHGAVFYREMCWQTGIASVNNRFNEQLDQFNKRAEKWVEEDRIRVQQQSEQKLKRIQEELDTDPELRKIYDELIEKMKS